MSNIVWKERKESMGITRYDALLRGSQTQTVGSFLAEGNRITRVSDCKGLSPFRVFTIVGDAKAWVEERYRAVCAEVEERDGAVYADVEVEFIAPDMVDVVHGSERHPLTGVAIRVVPTRRINELAEALGVARMAVEQAHQAENNAYNALMMELAFDGEKEEDGE